MLILVSTDRMYRAQGSGPQERAKFLQAITDFPNTDEEIRIWEVDNRFLTPMTWPRTARSGGATLIRSLTQGVIGEVRTNL